MIDAVALKLAIKKSYYLLAYAILASRSYVV